MLSNKRILLGLALIVWLAVFAGAWYQVSSQHLLNWHVVSAGGHEMQSANHALNGTTGQFAVVPMQSQNHALGSGYWHGLRPTGGVNSAYMPFVHR